MSSNIRIKRICSYCGQEFTAKTTATRYCSKACNGKDHKRRIRDMKIGASNEQLRQAKEAPIERLRALEFLTVTQVSSLLGCSRQSVYKLINSGKLNATNILEKKTLIKRSDIDNLFARKEKKVAPAIPENQKQELEEWNKSGAFDIDECYTLAEVQEKYGMSESTVYKLVVKHSIPKIKKGWYTYVPRELIDNIIKLKN